MRQEWYMIRVDPDNIFIPGSVFCVDRLWDIGNRPVFLCINIRAWYSLIYIAGSLHHVRPFPMFNQLSGQDA